MESPKVVVYGEVRQAYDYVDWDFASKYQEILDNTESFLQQDTKHLRYEPIDKIMVGGEYRVVQSKYDADSNTIIHCTDYLIRVEPSDPEQTERKIRMARNEAQFRLDN